MKKNVLALSISAAVCGLGMISTAHAITDLGVAASVGTAVQMKVNNDGIGNNIIIPYYTAQTTNATLINLTNTTSIGKAVKVRFRGAANSDDVLDFQVFMSPFDMWTAMVSRSATGEAQIVTNDVSCTKPAFAPGVPQKFLTARLDSSLTGDALANGTREGYVEIFNMADIAPSTASTSLATAITHVAGKAPCGAALNALDTDTTAAALITAGLTLPTTGLTANWTIVNLGTAAAYGGRGVAIQAVNAAEQAYTGAGVAITGNLVYWPQNSLFLNGETRGYTADPLLAGNLPAVVPPIKALNQDLPDMSTPYINMFAGGFVAAAGPYNNTVPGVYVSGAVNGNAWAATTQASLLTSSLAATSVLNEFFTDSATLAIGAATDWVFAMPTRRYNVAYNYASNASVFTNYAVGALLNTAVPPAASVSPLLNFFTLANTSVQSRKVCVDGITPVSYNREEQTVSTVSFSPSATPAFCGEVGVWAINKTAPTVSSVLDASVAVSGAATPYGEGWMNVTTPGLSGLGLPVIGAAFTKASSDATRNYGTNADHRSVRILGYAY